MRPLCNFPFSLFSPVLPLTLCVLSPVQPPTVGQCDAWLPRLSSCLSFLSSLCASVLSLVFLFFFFLLSSLSFHSLHPAMKSPVQSPMAGRHHAQSLGLSGYQLPCHHRTLLCPRSVLPNGSDQLTASRVHLFLPPSQGM